MKGSVAGWCIGLWSAWHCWRGRSITDGRRECVRERIVAINERWTRILGLYCVLLLLDQRICVIITKESRPSKICVALDTPLAILSLDSNAMYHIPLPPVCSEDGNCEDLLSFFISNF